MGEFAAGILINLLSDIILVSFASLLFILLAQLTRRWRRSRLIDFFKLSPQRPVITLYLSRHQSTANLPTIDSSLFDSESPIDALERIKAQQIKEKNQKLPQNKKTLSIQDFTTVSAEEMIEALRLKDELQKSIFFDWLPSKMREELSSSQAGREAIQVNIKVCPEPSDFHTLGSDQNNETMVFIGGPRANLGTYYYLYGEKAGRVRPGRLKKNSVEYIDSRTKPITCPGDRNLGVIQRSSHGARTIVYLAGTGVNGTVCAVAYLRKNWHKLHQKHRQRDFSVVIECFGRKKDISDYISQEDNQSWVLAEL